ncbi:glycosyltransferase [Rhizobium redzepovicii]|uniref:Glycosyltransferase n=1 Tax=Rhizobium redzepovicii TaxID=2867518 RepID=A0AAW8NZN1_9HYPH|nr:MULTISPECIES: glycosyltransferase [Rhizobium]MBY4587594.1 glucuronosyltransferase [Rhizobium redzepovicii]MBY4616771.1 glucuronosyltransferase [Rhizobium redzepovicii]MDF0658978.1 glycosyltransferase [Rhizobium sp. BC49]MDR9759486.1 glycosyltransferase [Rhizobium redzepovicii]MDR9784715.1 glycosyltransferase [Rhizobium redzepovicii]
MILVTVGTQLPFDRLVKAVDTFAKELSRPVLAQIGKGTYTPQNMKWIKNIEPADFDRVFFDASVIVSHAGIGTVLTAKRFGKPIILVPRQASLGEHRNDHQLATVGQLAGRPGIYVAHSDDDLRNYLLDDLDSPSHEDPSELGRASLVNYLKGYLATV